MPNTQQTEKKAKRRFNIIDAFIIILVLLCVLGIYFRGQITEWMGVEKNVEDYQIYFKVSGIRYTSEQYFYRGSQIYIDSGNIVMGTLEDYSVNIAEVYVDGANGEPVLDYYPNNTYLDIAGTIKCEGLEKNSRFYLGGTYSLAPGSQVNVHTEIMDFVMTITKIEKISK